MDFIQITKENLAKEHICCAISSDKDPQVAAKKSWLASRLDEGLVFLKSTERGKCFIEYLPAEAGWIPVEADHWMLINCLWVSGSFKGHGYSRTLMDRCLNDSREKGCAGVCVLSAKKKMPFLSDPKFLTHFGFRPVDESDCGVQLWALPFSEGTALPRFTEAARHPHTVEAGFVIYYTSQCPYPTKYVPLLKTAADKAGIPFRAVHIETREQAQQAPTPVTSFSMFRDGRWLTNEIPSEKKFTAMLENG